MTYGKIPEGKIVKGRRWGVGIDNKYHIHCVYIEKSLVDDTVYLKDTNCNVITTIKEDSITEVTICKPDYWEVCSTSYLKTY